MTAVAMHLAPSKKDRGDTEILNVKRSNIVKRCFLGLMIAAGLVSFSPSIFGKGHDAAPSRNKLAAHAINIVDQFGRPDPGARPSATSQIFDVTVAPGGSRVFSPSTVNISAGDTVRWTWGGSGHNVTSGSSCTADSQFCSPADMNCSSGPLSDTGTVYSHTFAQVGTYSYYCSAHCFSGMVGTVNVAAAAACTTPPSGMVGWYPGDGHARDLSCSRNFATLINGATYAAGKVGQAFFFDGVDDSVEAPANPRQDLQTAATLDAWVMLNQKPSAAGRVMEIISRGDFSRDLDLLLLTDDRFYLYISNGANVGSTTAVQTGVWYHVAGTWDASGLKMYVNGILENTNPTPNIIRSPSPAAKFIIGAGSLFGGRQFSGLIDEAELIDHALMQSEVQAIFNADSHGKCKPPSPTAAFSRKTHGSSGTFDIDLVPTGKPGIECRSGGASNVYQMIVQFANPITVAGATLTTGTGMVTGVSASGSVATVDLSNVASAQTIVVCLMGANDGMLTGDVPIGMSVLIGDTNGNGSVNASDVSQTKGQSGQQVTASNFREDVNGNGSINASDVSAVKSKSGTALP
jgi:plastocyanin